jgi:hypothetical protein
MLDGASEWEIRMEPALARGLRAATNPSSEQHQPIGDPDKIGSSAGCREQATLAKSREISS